MDQASAKPTAWIELPAAWGDPARCFVFGEPLDTWQATRLADVRPALERVTVEQKTGRYVVGFLSYESAPAFDPAMRTPPPGDLPFASFASFAKPQTTNLKPQNAESEALTLEFRVTKADYVAAVNRALDHIRSGDIYQVNYTIRAILSPSVYRGDREGAFSLFQTLLAAVPMPHAAYLDFSPSVNGGASSLPSSLASSLISLSPELFIRRRGNIIESLPMKGTAKREPSWATDEAARIALSQDEKNRAENVMIVDLVRNDLGRVCKLGSVTVPELWRVDRFPTVHQMTSLVRGELRDDLSLFDIFAALFPPGSVTGAPKIRAMEIIAELEPEPRGIYCGTIGIFFPNGDFECNVAIRTLESHPSSLIPHPFVLGLGSGIVADSDPENEWQETLLKGNFVSLRPQNFILYETIRYDSDSVHPSSLIPHPSSLLP